MSEIPFVPSADDPVWRALQAALKTAAPYRPLIEADAPLFEGGLDLMSLELLEFFLAIERELKVPIATEALPESALLSLGSLHEHVAKLLRDRERLYSRDG